MEDREVFLKCLSIAIENYPPSEAIAVAKDMAYATIQFNRVPVPGVSGRTVQKKKK